jgi:hypothetical protein
MACELLTGLDPEAMAPAEGLPRYPVHFPDGTGGAEVSALYPPVDGGSAAGRLWRVPSPRSNRHWRAGEFGPALDRLASDPTAAVSLGIAAAAFIDFGPVRLAKQAGRLFRATPFVVAFPTPYTIIAGLDDARFSPALMAAVERCLVAEIRELLQAVPAEELAIQFDVCAETRIWESRGRELGGPRELPERLLESAVKIAEAVPVESGLGWHFCSRGSRAGVGAPHDAAQVTRLAGAIIASTDRQPHFVDIPVPASRDDADYFAPLANLALWPTMDVFLALVHAGDDVEKAWRRFYAASTVLSRFGISPACGSPPEQVLPVLGQLLARGAPEVPYHE